jgi:hypothetical protein
MLTVDVTQRITITGIKTHPAFRVGLNSWYLFPAPIPGKVISDPIDPSSLGPDILNILAEIGLKDPVELSEQLLTTENSIAKIFVGILMNPFCIEALPWERAHVGDPNPVIEPSFIADGPEMEFNRVETAGEPVALQERPHELTAESFVNYSLAHSQPWIDDTSNGTQTIDEASIGNFEGSVWNLMAQIQAWLSGPKFAWFHPNSLQILVRSSDGCLYFSVNAILAPGAINLVARLHRGDIESFKEIVNHLMNNMAE